MGSARVRNVSRWVRRGPVLKCPVKTGDTTLGIWTVRTTDPPS